MTLIRKLALVLFSVLWLQDYSNAQDVQTSAWLTDNTYGSWAGCYTNGGTMGTWGGYSGGPCPNMSTGGTGAFRFSYGQSTVSQSYDLELALQAAGTGLQINGYNYHWYVKNSNINGEQPGNYDPIAYINVTLYNRDGSVAISDKYDYGYYIGDWAVFGGTRTYENPYALSQVKDLTVSITGKDSGFWAGWYGPEFAHVSISVNYSVDPCASDPLYAPTCAGYLDALAKLIPASDPVVELAATPVTETSVVEAAPVAAAAVQQSSSEPQTAEPAATAEQRQEQSGEKKGASLSTILSIVGKEQSRIAAVEQSVVSESVSQAMKDADKMTADAEAVAQQSSNQSQDQASTEQNNNQTQTAAVQQASVQTTVSAASLAARSGPAEQRIEEKKEEQTSQQDQDTSSQAQPNRQDDSAQAVVQQNQNMEPPKPQMIVQDSQPQQQMDISILVPVQNMQTESQASQGAVEVKQPDPIKMEETQAPVQVFAVEQRPVSSQPIATAPQQEISAPSLIPPSLADPIRIEAVIQDSLPTNYSLIPERRVAEEIEMPKMEEYKAVTTNPAEDFKDSKPPVMEQQQQSQGQQVKSNVQDNEAAGGVSLDRMAVQPAGYAQYSIALQDAAFYEPKEIYKGQKVVDNAKALRQLATDKLHQEMVEQQYKK